MKRFILNIALVAFVTSFAIGSAPQAHALGLTATDVATAAGIARTTNDEFGNNVVFDYNGDGVSDLVLGNHLNFPSEVFRGNADGTFTRIQELSPAADRHGCTAGNFNTDSLPDIYCSLGAQHGTSDHKSNELWLQDTPGHFALAPNAYGANDPTGRGRDAGTFNGNDDGVDDIVVGNEFPEAFPSVNKIYLSKIAADGSVSFIDTPYGPKDRSGGDCIATADYNFDGIQDLYICGNPDQIYANTVVGTPPNTTHVFTSMLTKSTKIPNTHNTGAQWGDMNGDGRPDLVTVNSTLLNVYLSNGKNAAGDVTFTSSYTKTLVAGRNLALADVDGNGALDIYVVQGRVEKVASSPNQPDYLLMNGGNGATFTNFSGLPQASSGAGSNVGVIPNYNGKPAFVVSNGGDGTLKFTGPRQLIAFN